MSREVPGGLTQHVRSLAVLWQDDRRSDEQLLTAFARAGDQPAFTLLVGRHGASVWAICRSILTDDADAEDAFQSTFVALARECRGSCPKSVPNWLSCVAHNTALDIRKASHRREVAHQRLCEQTRCRSDEVPSDDELREVVREELAKLPLGLRAPVALFYLEGKTQAEIGRFLGMPNQTVSYRIRKGLSALRKNLARRGMVVTAAALVAFLGGVPTAFAVSARLVASTAEAAFQSLADCAAPAATSTISVGVALSPLSKVLMVGLAVSVAVMLGNWTGPKPMGTEVSGSVLLGRDPLVRAEVVLVPDHGEDGQCKTAHALTDREGRFRFPVGSDEGQVVPGRYRVLVLDQIAVVPKEYARRVPPDYHVPLQTPLRLDIGAAPVVFDIPIDPVAKARPLPAPEYSPGWDFRRKLQLVILGLPREEFGRLESLGQ